MSQPIIRGIQAVGAVDIKYTYNGDGNKLYIPEGFKFGDCAGADDIASTGSITANGLLVAGFRLDGEFIRANPQIASSFMVPILGGGGIALTNNNRTGSLVLRCSRVSTPDTSTAASKNMGSSGKMYSNGTRGIGPTNASTTVYDMVLLAQLQQAQQGGGDSCGAQITIEFQFCGYITKVIFEACTVATVSPLGMSGNDAADYQITFNYLNWYPQFDKTAAGA